LVGQLHTGGLERQLCYFLQTLDRERYRPAVAVWTHSEDDLHVAPIRELGVPLYALPQTASSAVKLRAFRRLVGELRPEVVHSTSYYLNFAAYSSVIGRRSIAIGSVRGDFRWEREGSGPLVGRLSAAWPRDHICNSSSAAESVRDSRSLFAP